MYYVLCKPHLASSNRTCIYARYSVCLVVVIAVVVLIIPNDFISSNLRFPTLASQPRTTSLMPSNIVTSRTAPPQSEGYTSRYPSGTVRTPVSCLPPPPSLHLSPPPPLHPRVYSFFSAQRRTTRQRPQFFQHAETTKITGLGMGTGPPHYSPARGLDTLQSPPPRRWGAFPAPTCTCYWSFCTSRNDSALSHQEASSSVPKQRQKPMTCQLPPCCWFTHSDYFFHSRLLACHRVGVGMVSACARRHSRCVCNAIKRDMGESHLAKHLLLI